MPRAARTPARAPRRAASRRAARRACAAPARRLRRARRPGGARAARDRARRAARAARCPTPWRTERGAAATGWRAARRCAGGCARRRRRARPRRTRRRAARARAPGRRRPVRARPVDGDRQRERGRTQRERSERARGAEREPASAQRSHRTLRRGAQIGRQREQEEGRRQHVASLGDPADRFAAQRVDRVQQRGEGGGAGQRQRRRLRDGSARAREKGQRQGEERQRARRVEQQVRRVEAGCRGEIRRLQPEDRVVERQREPGERLVVTGVARRPHPAEVQGVEAADREVVRDGEAVVPGDEARAQRRQRRRRRRPRRRPPPARAGRGDSRGGADASSTPACGAWAGRMMVDVTASSHVARRDGPWLYGPGTDLLLGAGAGYLLSIPLLVWLGSRLALPDWPIEVDARARAAGLARRTTAPRCCASTSGAEDRRRYRLFALHVSLRAGRRSSSAALYWHWLGSLLITLYFAWSPWHFAGQNYGLSLLFLRRRGVGGPAGGEARALHRLRAELRASPCWSSRRAAARPSRPSSWPTGAATRCSRSASRARSVAPLARCCSPAFVGALAAVGAAAACARARAPPICVGAGAAGRPQAQWFVLPALLASRSEPLAGTSPSRRSGSRSRTRVQYLWVTSYYAKQSGAEPRLMPYFVKALLAGCLIGEVPALLFAPRLLGPLSWSGGLAMLLFAVINLHHFVLDGAVWKLRDGRVARLLLRSEAADRTRRRARGARWRPRSSRWARCCLAGAAARAVGRARRAQPTTSRASRRPRAVSPGSAATASACSARSARRASRAARRRRPRTPTAARWRCAAIRPC